MFALCEIFSMKSLRDWISKEGTEGRKLLYDAIKAQFPTFQQNSLSNYIAGERIPDLKKAEIISKITKIPLSELPWRFVNIPGGDKAKLTISCQP